MRLLRPTAATDIKVESSDDGCRYQTVQVLAPGCGQQGIRRLVLTSHANRVTSGDAGNRGPSFLLSQKGEKEQREENHTEGR